MNLKKAIFLQYNSEVEKTCEPPIATYMQESVRVYLAVLWFAIKTHVWSSQEHESLFRLRIAVPFYGMLFRFTEYCSVLRNAVPFHGLLRLCEIYSIPFVIRYGCKEKH